MDDEILAKKDDPGGLEELYRADKAAFMAAFKKLAPESLGAPYDFWRIRIEADEAATLKPKKAQEAKVLPMHMVIILALAAGTLAKLPGFFRLDELFFYSRFATAIPFLALGFYFILRGEFNRKLAAVLGAAFAVSLLWAGLLADPTKSDTSVLVMLHLPVFYWFFAGAAFIGGDLKRGEGWIDCLKFTGEFLVFSAIILIAGMMLTGMTVGLFAAMNVDIMDFYVRWVAAYGAAATPLVAAHLVLLRSKEEMRISSTVAKIFSPLFLTTLTAYLIVMAAQRRSPFVDRDLLIVFNAMMLFVLALSIYGIIGRKEEKGQRWLDMTTAALLGLALIIDLIALSAIIFRLASYGLTPNRIAVLGLNLITLANVGYLGYYYLESLRDKRPFAYLTVVVSRFLAVYAVWAAFIIFLFPVIYWFK